MKVTYVGGAGRLGYPLALWSSQWHDVVIADINQKVVDAINADKYEPYEPLYEAFDRSLGKPPLAATDVEYAVRNAELIFVIVPTPSVEDGSFNIDYVLEACQEIGKGLEHSTAEYPTVVIVSTVNPGDCDGRIKDKLHRFSGRVINPTEPTDDGVMGLVYSPEFVRQGSIMRDFANPDFILLGCGEVPPDVITYYDTVTENSPPFYTMSLPSAEIAKLGLNCAVTTKMTVANNLAWLCHLTPGADAEDVLLAIGQDRRIGNAYFKAGPPPGGPCFPRDVRALARSCGLRDVDPTLPMAVDYSRKWQAVAVTWHVGAYVSYFGLQGLPVLVLGLTYKPGVNITTESMGFALADTLDSTGLPYSTHDPSVDDQQDLMRKLATCGLIVLTTDWPQYKALEELDLTGRVIFDLWGMLDESRLQCLQYIRLGRHQPMQMELWTGRPQR